LCGLLAGDGKRVVAGCATCLLFLPGICWPSVTCLPSLHLYLLCRGPIPVCLFSLPVLPVPTCYLLTQPPPLPAPSAAVCAVWRVYEDSPVGEEQQPFLKWRLCRERRRRRAEAALLACGCVAGEEEERRRKEGPSQYVPTCKLCGCMLVSLYMLTCLLYHDEEGSSLLCCVVCNVCC